VFHSVKAEILKTKKKRMKKFILLCSLLMATTFAFAQSRFLMSVGSNSTNAGTSMSYDLGCINGNTMYTIGVENFSMNDTNLVGFRVQENFRTLTPKTMLGWYTAVKTTTQFDNNWTFEPGLVLSYRHNQHYLIQGSFGTHLHNSYSFNDAMGFKVGISLSYIH
jgi:hypothetical protein